MGALHVFAALFQSLLQGGSYLVFFLFLLAAGVGFPIAEEIVVLTAGALSRQNLVEVWIALVVCYAGVLSGDLVLFLVSRRLGDAALQHPRFRKLLPPKRLHQLRDFYSRRGGVAILIARQIPGVRAPVFALAGIQHMELKRFLFWDAIAACFNTPAVFFLGWLFSDRLTQMHKRVSHLTHWIVFAVVVIFAAYALISYWRSTQGHPLQDLRSRWRKWRQKHESP
ncbi:MAG TPA: DedA family protein [Vulgatibacter sp.]